MLYCRSFCENTKSPIMRRPSRTYLTKCYNFILEEGGLVQLRRPRVAVLRAVTCAQGLRMYTKEAGKSSTLTWNSSAARPHVNASCRSCRRAVTRERSVRQHREGSGYRVGERYLQREGVVVLQEPHEPQRVIFVLLP